MLYPEVHCSACGQQGCDKDCLCARSVDGKHVPDPESARYGTRRKDFVVIDFCCKDCGKLGGVKVDLRKVEWE